MLGSEARFGRGYVRGIVPRPLNARAWIGTALTILLVVFLCLTGRYLNQLIAGGLLAYYLGLIYTISEEGKPAHRTTAAAAEHA